MMYAHTANTQRFARTTASPRATGRYVRARAEKDIGQEIKETLKENVSQSAASETTAMKEDATNVTHPATPGSAVGDSLKPRVEELRQDQIGKGTTDPGQIMKFSGPAPELINGRLAMVGFVAAMAAEIATHRTIFQQLAEAPGPILAFSALIAVASIIPIVRGTDKLNDGAGEGIRPGFNLTNELINGRAAMLGIALVIIFEAGSRSPLF